ncbi:MAG: 1-acyl-sn-glycerol-3-phosphate acyltransferase [Bacteroidales bacterium]|nr:1-acyl-sn-glycerol-3-phosphate acyltransferase [Bacteroidales bacterium]MCF8404465.1 1-acyl-sn-glycerol-3-phosphate acyltransferase [Bacteroidales bacterium]
MSDIQITERTINIEKVFRDKGPKTAKFIPGFLFTFLRRIIHEKEINSFLYQNKEKYGLDFVDSLILNFGAKISVDGQENIPPDRRSIIAANHPLGGLDGVALMHVVGKVNTEIVFPVNDILMFLPNLQPLFIPVNKHGSNQDNFQIIHETFESEKLMLYFPAGLVSRKQNGKIEDLEWKKTFISKAKKYKRDIIPTYIDGRNSNFFYNLASLRKKLSIKANIEMLFLPNEMFHQKNKNINIKFGPTIPYTTFDKRYNFDEWASKVKRYVYAMGKGLDEPFNPDKNYE